MACIDWIYLDYTGVWVNLSHVAYFGWELVDCDFQGFLVWSSGEKMHISKGEHTNLCDTMSERASSTPAGGG